MHDDRVCPKYNEPVLPDENGKCSLCGADIANMDEIYICELCQRAYEPVPGALDGLKILKIFKGYIVDLRLQQFRKVVRGEDWKLIGFTSPEGRALLAQMHEEVMR